MTFFLLLLLWCAVSNVPKSSCSSADGFHSRDEGALWSSRCPMASIRGYSWRPRRRPQVIGSAPFTRGIGCPRKSSTTRWQPIISGTSLPCGIDLQLSKTSAAHQGRRILEFLARVFTMWTSNHGEPGRGEGCTESIELRTQDENDTDFGSRRRWRICGSRRRCKSGVVPAVFWLWLVGYPRRRRRIQRWSSSVHCIGGSSLRTLRNEGATWSSYTHSVEDVLQASSNLPHNAGRSKIGGLARLHGYQMAVERLSRTYPTAWHLIYAADEVARSSQSNRPRSKIMMGIRAGKAPPEGFDQNTEVMVQRRLRRSS